MKKLSVVFVSLWLFLFLPVKVFAGSPPVQGNSQYTLPSGTAPSDGNSTETVSVHLQDNSQNSVVGDVVTLSSSNDSTATFPQNNQTTDSNGNAAFTVATTTPGDVKITLYDSTNSVTFTDWFTLTFYDTSKGCVNNPPAPTLTTVVSSSNNTATLTWVDSVDPVSNYLISYGIVSKSYIYGDTNVGGQGTTSFTVGALTGGKKYYFVVAANNNCGTSGFSNEISVIANPVPATPAPTIAPTDTPIATATPLSNVSTSTAVVAVLPPDTPPDTPVSQTFQSNTQDTNVTFRNLGIGVITAGIILIGSVFIFQKMKKKNSIPPIGGNEIQDSPPQILDPPKPGGNVPPWSNIS